MNTIEEAFLRTREVLARKDRPTAFFATMDILAIGIYSGISESGLRIPEDISVAGFDNIFMAQYMLPPLTTYNAPVDALARESIDCLLAQIENPENARKVVLQGELIERRSVKKEGI